MKRHYILISLIVTSLFFACSSDDSSNDDDPQGQIVGGCDTTFPFLQTGRVMTYAVNGNSAGAVLEFGNCDANGYYIDRAFGGLAGTDLYRQNGDFLEIDSNNDGDYFSITYKQNASLGDTWTYTQPSGDIVTREVISVDSTITVPAGTFTCKVISYQDSGTINTTYVFWDDQVGQIKEDAGFFVTELESYQ